MKELTLIDLKVETRTLILTQKHCTLLSDCLRFVMDDQARREASNALFEVFHNKDGAFTPTIAKWYVVEHTVMCLQGHLQETLSFETFPD